MRSSLWRICSLLLLLIAVFGLSGGAAAQDGAPAAASKARLWAADDLLASPPMSVAGQTPRRFQDAGVPVLSGAGLPSALGDWTRIAFQSYRDGNWEIYLARGDGTEPLRLTYPAADDIRPRLNRGADKIAFVSNRSGNYDIYTMNADGSNVRQLTNHGPSDTYPAWSPDGSQIVFAYYKDEDWEIYLMNADGSAQRRVTNGGGPDVMPTWSPDGRQIAWVQRGSNTTSRIMVMDANGNNQHALTPYLKYLEFPSWSPDGSQIAFDYDADGDDWNELAVMLSDGNGRRTVYDPGGSLVDAWMGSWAPDGTKLLCSLILYVVQNNQLYIGATGPVQVNLADGVASALPGTGVDMLFDWQTADILPPTSSMAALPPQSPSPFTVSWSGIDLGPAGLIGYDVQMRDGASAAWADWQTGTLATSAVYPGIGGHTYYFRARGRDQAGNVEPWPADYDAVTTVEALPPNSALELLPRYLRNGSVIRWHGDDPGGSGIESYDVQVRDLAVGDWTDWLTNVHGSMGRFNGAAGHTFAFRVRATDHAQNVEPWHTGTDDASTILYTWAITGTVQNNVGEPVAGAAVRVTPAAFEGGISAVKGAYNTYTAAVAPTYTVSWGKTGYSLLPETSFASGEDAHRDVILPPLDNVVADWGFESANLLPAWQARGALTATVTDQLQDTGRYAAQLGQAIVPFGPQLDIFGDRVGGTPQMVVDKTGVVHVIWNAYPHIYYANRPANGIWTQSVDLAELPSGCWGPVMVADDADVLHMACEGPDAAYYMQRAPNSVWSSPEMIPDSLTALWGLALKVDLNGEVHVVWIAYEPGTWNRAVFYARRGSNGFWTTPENISHTLETPSDPQLVTDLGGNVHVVWWELGMGYTSIIYRRRAVDGTWSTRQNLSGGQDAIMDTPLLAIDGNDTMHVAYRTNTNPCLYYSQRRENTEWSPPECAVAGWPTGAQMAVDRQGIVHVVWIDSDPRYVQRRLDGTWLAPRSVAAVPGAVAYPQITTAEKGVAHVAWFECNNAICDLYHVRRNSDETWAAPRLLASRIGAPKEPPRLRLDGHGNAHLVWGDPATWHYYYLFSATLW